MIPQNPHSARRGFATVAMAGIIVYVLVDVVLQFLPPHYSVISDAESNLAVGPFGWIMNLNFLGRTLTTLCALAAINLTGPTSRARRMGTWLMLAGGLSSAILAFFPTDVENAAGILEVTTVGTVHLFVAALGFLAALAGIWTLTRWIRSSPELAKAYPTALIFTVLAGTGLVSLILTHIMMPDLLGLAERICLAGLLGWVLVVCASIRKVPLQNLPESKIPEMVDGGAGRTESMPS